MPNLLKNKPQFNCLYCTRACSSFMAHRCEICSAVFWEENGKLTEIELYCHGYKVYLLLKENKTILFTQTTIDSITFNVKKIKTFNKILDMHPSNLIDKIQKIILLL